MAEKIRFTHEGRDLFFETLRRRVDLFFIEKGRKRHGGGRLWAKAALVFVAYAACLAAILVGKSPLIFYPILGFLTVPLILNIGHEAAHGSFSPSKKVNALLGLVFHLGGADGAIWRFRHVSSHHVLPNVPGHDLDIAQNRLARIAPRSEWLAAHRWQHFYMPFLYLVYTLNWLLWRDFRDFFAFFWPKRDRWQRLMGLVATKVFYFGHLLFLPLFWWPEQRGATIAGFVLMQMVASATTFLVLVSAHVGENAVFPEPDENGLIGHSWAAHQLITTTDFAPQNGLVTHLFGGFNHHVAHHLFPTVSHVHYPDLTAIARATAIEFGLPYNALPTLGETVVSHFRFLKKNALPPDFFEKADF